MSKPLILEGRRHDKCFVVVVVVVVEWYENVMSHKYFFWGGGGGVAEFSYLRCLRIRVNSFAQTSILALV